MKNITRWLSVCVSLCYAMSSLALNVLPNTVVDSPLTIQNQTVNIEKGNLIIKNKATLTLINCNISGTITPANPILINIQDGHLVLKESSVELTTQDINPHPTTQSLQYFIKLFQGDLNLIHNHFLMKNRFTAGFFITNNNINNTHLNVDNNTFENFHGVLYLLNVSNSTIQNNLFNQNSYGNIVINGTDNSLIENKIKLSGYNIDLGNSIDILNSNNIKIYRNELLSSYLNGIFIYNSSNINVIENRISGSKYFGIKVQDNTSATNELNINYLPIHLATYSDEGSILINKNYISQNHYGLTALDVKHPVIVTNNNFSQKFSEPISRQFWTDNCNLIKNTPQLTWTNNTYREAFTQKKWRR